MDRKITAYSVIGSNSAQDLVNSVMHSLKEGWQPLGAISVAIDSDMRNEENQPSFHFTQVVVMYEEIIFNG